MNDLSPTSSTPLSSGVGVGFSKNNYKISAEQCQNLQKMSPGNNIQIVVHDEDNNAGVGISGIFRVEKGFTVPYNIFKSNSKYENRVFKLGKKPTKKGPCTYHFMVAKPGETIEGLAFVLKTLHLADIPKAPHLITRFKEATSRILMLGAATSIVSGPIVAMKSGWDYRPLLEKIMFVHTPQTGVTGTKTTEQGQPPIPARTTTDNKTPAVQSALIPSAVGSNPPKIANDEKNEHTSQLDRAREINESVYTYVCRHERSIDWTDEKWNDKMGKIRPGLDKKDKKGKLIYPNDGPTIDPGIDLGQVEIDHLYKIFGEIGLDTSVVAKIIELAQVAREYKKKNGIGLKTLSETYSYISLTPEQLKKASIIAMHLYVEEYIYPQISKFKSAPIPVQQALLSIYYHRGPYWISTKYPQALKQLNEGNWYNSTVLAMIKTPNGSSNEMKKRAKKEYTTYVSERATPQDKNEQTNINRIPFPFNVEDAYIFHQKYDTRPTPSIDFCASHPPVKKSLLPVYTELGKNYQQLKNTPSDSTEYLPLRARCVALANLLDGDRHGLLYSYVQGKKSYGVEFQIPGAKKGQTSGISPRARSYLGDCSTEVATGIMYIVADSIKQKHDINFSTAEFDKAFGRPRGGFTQIFNMLVRTGAGKVYARNQVYDKNGDILPSFQEKIAGKAAFSWLQNIGEHGGMLLSDGSICDAGVMHNKYGSGIGIREQHTMFRGKPIHSVTKGVCVIEYPDKLTKIMESHLRKIGKIPSAVLASR